MLDQSWSGSNGNKLIRFFRIVSVFGGVVIFVRILLFIALVGGVLYYLP